MRRYDLPEIEDYPWFPSWLRDAMTGFLQVVIEATRPYAPVGPILAELLQSTGHRHVIDLASGGGGPWIPLMQYLSEAGVDVEVQLSDLYPNDRAALRLAGIPGLSYAQQPVSALDVSASFTGVRTMFSSLHHFERDSVKQMLLSAQRARVPFVGAEATERSARGPILTIFIPLLVLFLMPRVRPRRFLPLLLTYLPPVMPVLIWWDGFASTLRTHTADELRAIAAEIASPEYLWEVREIQPKGAPMPLTVVVGRPIARV